MHNIIQFLLIIVIIAFLMLVIDKNRRKNTILILVLGGIVVVNSLYYYLPTKEVKLDEREHESVIRLYDLPFSINKYTLMQADNKKLIDMIKSKKMRRISSDSALGHGDVFVIDLRSQIDSMYLYSISVNKKTGISRIHNSMNSKKYMFKANEELLAYLYSIDAIYRQAALDKSSVDDVKVDLVENVGESDYRNFNLEILLENNDIKITEIFVSYKYVGGGSSMYYFTNNIVSEDGDFSLNFDLPRKTNHDRELIPNSLKLYIRGERSFEGKYIPFQKIVLVE